MNQELLHVCAGQGHSSNPLVTTSDMLITLDGLLQYAIDKEAKTITVTAGVDLNALDRLLAAEGLALATNVVLTSVQVSLVLSPAAAHSSRLLTC